MKPSTSSAATVESVLIAEAKAHFESAQAALRKGCEHALLAGLRLIVLHSAEALQGTRNDTSITWKSSGFEAALAEIGMLKKTAYRWMNATGAALQRACLLMGGGDIAGELPAPGTPRWEAWEADLRKVAQGMSLNRLMLGTVKNSTEDQRYDELISADEEGRTRASDLLAGVAEGRYTLVQAVRALGSQEAYDTLRAEGREKVRKDPVYLDYNLVEKCSSGLLPKALITLRNGLQEWETFDPKAREAFLREWKAVAAAIPTELLRAIVPNR